LFVGWSFLVFSQEVYFLKNLIEIAAWFSSQEPDPDLLGSLPFCYCFGASSFLLIQGLVM
jgi:hypothetical protein